MSFDKLRMRALGLGVVIGIAWRAHAGGDGVLGEAPGIGA
jgi:hypothetical protein